MIYPKTHDLKCYRGQTWTQDIYLKRDGIAVDLTGAAVKAQVRPSDNALTLIAEMACSVVAEEGKITLGIDAATTSNLQDGIYRYDVRVTQDSTVTYYIEGLFVVKGRVTYDQL